MWKPVSAETFMSASHLTRIQYISNYTLICLAVIFQSHDTKLNLSRSYSLQSTQQSPH